MKSNIIITVEFLAGTDIKKAISEAKIKAETWDVAYVCFDFNGIRFSIGRNADVEKAAAEYINPEKPKYGIIHS